MGVMMGVLIIVALASFLLYPLTRRFGRHAFAVPGTLLTIVFAIFVVLSIRVFNGEILVENVPWIPQLDLSITLRLDAVSALFALLVTGAGALIFFYCVNYFSDTDTGLARFSSVFMGFSVSMLGLVLADNVYLLFVFWEATTVFSFLLIGHMTRLRTANAAALQALMVTTLGGLAMLVGFVILVNATGSALLSEIVAEPTSGPLVTVAVYLLLAGALSKSAILPFHFWLPGAMAAPTPVSAYLHAAAMVKAGIYLIARIVPGYGDTPGLSIVLVVLGGITMLLGGIRALKQYDIKLIVAYGTVSQLGLLVMIFGVADPLASFAGFAMLFAHAFAKAPLFLAVGIIDHTTGTRDLRRLSGVGRKLPALALLTILAAASMSGLPPFIGFVAKEAAFAELLAIGTPIATLAFWVAVVGSVLTVAYMVRLVWGAFADKPGVKTFSMQHRPGYAIGVAPSVFVAFTLLGGLFAGTVDRFLQQTVPVEAQTFALWHGITPAFWASVAVLTLGLLLGWLFSRTQQLLPTVPERYTAAHMYWLVTHWFDVLAVRITALTQRGSLPFYLAVILITVVVSVGSAVVIPWEAPATAALTARPVEVPIVLLMIIAAVYTLKAQTRFKSVVLVGVTGYGMAAIFATHGAPDLALTQVLVETVTLIAFVLVLRRLPQRFSAGAKVGSRIVRIVISSAVALVLGAVAIIALNARVADPISLELPGMAEAGGHGANVVNVILVDIRAWDTLGELSVILAAATGVASLVFLKTRADLGPKISRRTARDEAREHLLRVADPNDPIRRITWLLAGRYLDAGRRSIMLEVVVRVVFHGLIVLSIYLLLTGHNTPGGGFAAGLVAGLALVARYLAGGRHELGATVPLDAGRILGTGLALAVSMAIIPLFFGQSALASSWIDLDLGPFGMLPLVTSTVFDIGVYLVVFGLILDVLRSLGSEIDAQEEADDEAREGVSAG